MKAIRVVIESAEPAGTVVVERDGGEPRSFSGWLELVRLLEDATDDVTQKAASAARDGKERDHDPQ